MLMLPVAEMGPLGWASVPHLQIIICDDIFVVIDDGQSTASEISKLGRRVQEQAKRYPGGIGAVTIVPPSAKPPSAEARQAIGDLLSSVGSSVRSACWIVEGGGFQGAMVRAVLTGLRMFGRYPYPTKVCTDVVEGLDWTLRQLSGNERRHSEVAKAIQLLNSQRR